MNAFVQSLDLCRVRFLKFTLGPAPIRSLYVKAHRRLATGLILCMLLYLPLAFLKPEWLLSFGPLIFGYPHLISSYRFTPEFKGFGLILFMTGVAFLLNVIKPGLPLPFGVWQIAVAAITFVILRRRHFKEVLISLSLSCFLIKLAWLEPIIFVGGSLILHNWVAFYYWIRLSRTSERRYVAIAGTVLFFIIHLIVLSGHLDSFIPMTEGGVAFPGNTQNTAWMLASWTDNPIIWFRFMVLYAFGLSVHYFIWLRAIPESFKPSEHASSFRLINQNLKTSLGHKTFVTTMVVVISGLILWLISMPAGSRFYFEVAILHGWLELVFMISKKEKQLI